MFRKRRARLPELAVLGGIFLLQLALFFSLRETLTPDSYEYLAADGLSWLSGAPHRYRQPLYPMLLDACNALFGERGLTMVCVVQLLVHLLSVLAFYNAMQRIAPRRGLSLAVTAFYSLSPAVISWQSTILTESLALSLSVFVLWALVCYLNDAKARYLIFAALALLLGSMLRAVFALYAGLVFGFLLLRLIFPGKGEAAERRARRVREARLLPIAAVPLALLLLYGALFHARYGAFTLSDSGTAQQLAVVLQQGYYLDAQDKELRELSQTFMTSVTSAEAEDNPGAPVLDERYEAELDDYYAALYETEWGAESFPQMYRARCYIMEHYDHARINAFVAEAKRANMMQYLSFLSQAADARFYALKTPTGTAFSFVITRLCDSVLPAQSLSLMNTMLAGVAELAIFAYLLVRRKRLQWLHLGLSAFILCTGALSIFGTNADFARTAQTLLPFAYAAAGLWVHMALERWQRAHGAPQEQTP